ncbi:Chondroitin synthase [Flagellimonas maritima]|uniref:Chondroitin synthase n=1 Tax=Flagellimonas maritima TaxID=1383885 RepID=A0A2Z4LWZ6_9FLAO|nr:glycosyltransferase family 2 protein [Allomuricauda aurantiaca]AWX45807.1 Chondroitin synthase [Allomuricauda aurantiaca]
MNKAPLVSIGIPFYNSDSYLKFAINSVIMQTYSNWELFLLNDGSTDNSVNIASSFEQEDARITLINDTRNKGLPARLNQLSELANGQYYCRMDADDIMHPKRIEVQVNHLLENPKIDLLGTKVIAIDNENKIIGLRKGLTKKKYTLNHVAHSGWCAHPTIIGKTSWFKDNKYDVSLKRSQDYDLWIRTVIKSNFINLENPYLYYREASTPTLKKYCKATLYKLKIFYKNKRILGQWTSFALSIKSMLKVLVYIFYWLLGQTNGLIKKRSVSLNPDQLYIHQKILKKIITL